MIRCDADSFEHHVEFSQHRIDNSGPASIYQLIQGINEGCGDKWQAFMEDVGYHVAGNSASSSVKFARHTGNLEQGLFDWGWPLVLVRPQVWMKTIPGLPKTPPRGSPKAAYARVKVQRKKRICEYVNQFYRWKIYERDADGWGIMIYALYAAELQNWMRKVKGGG